jgi:hemoglobin
VPHSIPHPNARTPEKIPTNPEGGTLYERLGGHEGLHRLVKWFYAKVRYEPLLEPIFTALVPVWSTHLETITEFWARATGGPSEWARGMGRHFFMQLGPEHFAAWLRVWDENCRELLPEAEANEMIALAHNIGDDLERMLARRQISTGKPAVDSPKPNL